MRDSDPRPMPPVVKAAYRNTIDLLWLLGGSVYSEDDRRQVRDSLLDALTRYFGVVHLPYGDDGETVTIAQKAKSIKDTLRSIDFILSVDDYGGKNQTLPYLAEAMENRWQEWWQSVSWKTAEDTSIWVNASENVLGRRQMAWLAAQYARSVIDLTVVRYAAVQAIEAAESWSVNPTEYNSKRAYEAFRIVSATNINDVADASYYASLSASQAARSASFELFSLGNAVYSAIAAAPENASLLCELTKQMITPSLVDAR
jgi:hypothetical protein